jgi:hypothetical protein
MENKAHRKFPIANGCHQRTLIPCQLMILDQPISTCHVLTGWPSQWQAKRFNALLILLHQ